MKHILLPCLSFIALSANAQDYVEINECLLHDGILKQIKVDYDRETGTKTVVVNGVRKELDEVYPLEGKEYAYTKDWYKQNKTLSIKGANYIKYGLPRVLGVTEVEKYATNDGIIVFVEAGTKETPEIIYLPVRRGCEFQPYQLELCVKDAKLTSNIKEVKPGGTVIVTANLPASTKKYTYEWNLGAGKIVGAATGKSITIKADSTKEDDIYVTLKAGIQGGKCYKSYASLSIPVLTKRFVSTAKRIQVQVRNWGSTTVSLLDDFWNKDIEAQVLKVLSKEEYLYMKDHITPKSWSAPVKSYMEWNRQRTNLKTYMVVAFDNIRNGKNYGKNLILVVPYADNKDVISASKPWSDFYILVDASALKAN